MHIDKSFQLLSADSGKVATDETRRQNAGDEDAEFSELLGAELSQQDQQKEAEKAAGADNKAGQEVAALLTKQAKTAEQTLADKAKAAVAASKDATDAANNTDNAAIATSGATLDVTVGVPTDVTRQAGVTIEPDADADFDAEQTGSSNPWLAIISQSHDFNDILSQSSKQSTAATHDAGFTSAEMLAAELLGVAATEKAAAGADPATAIAGQTTETSERLAEEQKLGFGKELASSGDIAKALSDTTLLNTTEGQQDTKGKAITGNMDIALNAGEPATTDSSRLTKLPSEQMSVRELVKSEQPHLQTLVAGSGDQHAADVSSGTAQQVATGSAATTSQPTQLQISAETVAGQLSQADGKGAKNSATAPVDVELPIEVGPDVKALSALVTESASAAPSAKNAPQSFAQFQKAANAAAAIVQKQLLQAEQTQQPLQDLAAQQPQKFAELNQILPGSHADAPIAFNTLLQTDRPINSGGAMGSSTGQQQQQAASQLFAAKLNDSVHSNEQPALNLLEPSAATQLKERVMFQVNQKIHSAEIKLAPEELGSMQIKVQLQQEQLSVQFVVQQAGAKEALEQQMPRLREMLEEQGIELTQGEVSQQREGSAEQRQTRERNQGLDQGLDTGDEPLQQQAIVRVSDRMVDYYA
ncbi:hypothetical protein A5320_08390 [Rheinheimera sp. SA_1]|uniref:flagellar hook-length control protein FliK n=1 Tax=Rheinheimera sp. SA_1 TaxID=1827365 RepID=UPI0007FF5FF3|nr:flagellar hook-length control protein FliK [Rheinheimera sp. SA_1]OBP15372.1 hypothetical protein A5320_08390 [Rheinheimera sp. SA_1]